MFRKLVRRQFLTVFCALRKVRFQCYCAQFNFNRIFLVLKLLSTTFYIIVKTLVRYLLQNPRYGGFKCLFEGLLSQFFADYAKYVSNATVLSSSPIGLFQCSNYFQRPFISSLKVWFRYILQNPRYKGLKNCFEDLFSQFLRITQSTFPLLLCSVGVQSYCSCAQTTFNGLLYHRQKFGLHTFCRSLVMEDSNSGSNAFSHSFFALRKVRFQCYCAQFKFNRIFLVLKLLSTTFYIIVKTLVQIPFVESSLWRIQILVRRPSLTVFCGLGKVRFQCYCAQFKFNPIFLVLKLLSTIFYIIVKTLALIHFVEASLWRFKKLVRRPFLTVFCGLRKVRFKCYCAQFNFNRIVLVLKLLSMTFYIIVKTFCLDTFRRSLDMYF